MQSKPLSTALLRERLRDLRDFLDLLIGLGLALRAARLRFTSLSSSELSELSESATNPFLLVVAAWEESALELLQQINCRLQIAFQPWLIL